MRLERGVEDLLRREAPQVLAALVRRYGHFDLAEDAVQDALLTAARLWPHEGVPEHPRGWLIRAGSRSLIDTLRAERSRREREDRHIQERETIPDGPVNAHDDSLLLLFLCCHPALSAPSQIALTLRAVGGLTTEEIARAFLVPAGTMGQRISRAKAAIAASGVPFRMPDAEERDNRIAAVLHVLYLIYNEGYVASSGDKLVRVDLAAEAIRLSRMLRAAVPGHGEATGLLALMLLTEARRPARIDDTGAAVPLADQDRTRWDQTLITEGTTLVEAAMTGPRLGAYQLQAAIAALHDQAASPQATDWPQILALYTLLLRFDNGPLIRLGRAVAVAMVHGPRAGLAELDTLSADPRLAGHHRLTAVRAHLLELAGDLGAARAGYELAARATLSTPEQRHLRQRAARLPAAPNQAALSAITSAVTDAAVNASPRTSHTAQGRRPAGTPADPPQVT